MSELYNGKSLPSGWLVYTTDDGRPYFHNRLTAATQWDPPSSSQQQTNGTTSTTTSSTVGAVLREAEDEELNGYGTTDGEITTTRGSGGGRMIHLAEDVGGSSRQLSAAAVSGKKKKGYSSLAGDLNGPMDLESGGKQGEPQSTSNVQSSSSQIADPATWCYFINVGYLQSLFDIDTKSVVNRILASMLPYKVLQEVASSGVSSSPSSSSSSSSSSSQQSNDHVVTSIRTSPDFYGPFWIPTSLIFFMFVTSNISAFIAGNMMETNFLALVVASSMLYGYLLAIPLIIWALTLFMGGASERESITMRQLIAVYGYSFAVALPIALLSLIPSMAVRWLLAVIGSGVSLLFVLFNFRRDLIESEPPFKLAVLALLVIAQISFYAAFPLYYFNY